MHTCLINKIGHGEKHVASLYIKSTISFSNNGNGRRLSSHLLGSSCSFNVGTPPPFSVCGYLAGVEEEWGPSIVWISRSSQDLYCLCTMGYRMASFLLTPRWILFLVEDSGCECLSRHPG